MLGFNPRARGGRDFPFRYFFYNSQVSIHAPAGGATGRQAPEMLTGCFNPRARGGRDIKSAKKRRGLGFQSTRPRGARRVLTGFSVGLAVSIHAPAGGATWPGIYI